MQDDPSSPRPADPSTPPTPAAARFVAGTFGFAFLGIGVSVIVFLWSQPFGEFGAPPLFFRVFGSLVALPFVAIGGTAAYNAVTGKSVGLAGPGKASAKGSPTGVGYQCPSCGAPLPSDAEVSPHGDVKCSHCNRWFNVHGASPV